MSRYTRTYIITNIKGKTIRHYFKKHIRKYGIPNKLSCDLGTQFTAQKFKDLAEKNNITIIFSTANSPTNNSILERIIKIINEIMRMMRNQTEIKTLKKTLHRRLNYIYCESTGYSGYKLQYKRNPFTKREIVISEEEIQKIKNNVIKKATKNLQRLNEKRKNYNYTINEKIFIKEKPLRKQD